MTIEKKQAVGDFKYYDETVRVPYPFDRDYSLDIWDGLQMYNLSKKRFEVAYYFDEFEGDDCVLIGDLSVHISTHDMLIQFAGGGDLVGFLPKEYDYPTARWAHEEYPIRLQWYESHNLKMSFPIPKKCLDVMKALAAFNSKRLSWKLKKIAEYSGLKYREYNMDKQDQVYEDLPF